MSFWEKFWLDYMLTALGITVAILGYDLSLLLRGLETITDHIIDHLRKWAGDGWKVSEFPWLSVVLPFGVSQQAFGLLFHFLSGWLSGK